MFTVACNTERNQRLINVIIVAIKLQCFYKNMGVYVRHPYFSNRNFTHTTEIGVTEVLLRMTSFTKCSVKRTYHRYAWLRLLTYMSSTGGTSSTADVLRGESTGVPPAMHGDPQRTCLYAHGEVSITYFWIGSRIFLSNSCDQRCHPCYAFHRKCAFSG